ncbi:MAG: GNAT family N-acetyltransferase, partial [Clostridia bacterium]|nr:GNAT family N-acetyltransferase [Clostridia bacterium]
KPMLINILNNSATVFCFADADVEEIDAYLKFSCVENVFCNETFALKSQNYLISSGVLLKCSDKEPGEKIYEKTFCPDYKSVYNLISNEFSLPEYNEFVSDFSCRLNHNLARIIQTENGVVFTAWEDEKSAIISAIAVYITKRAKGEGSALLKSMVFDLKQDKKNDIFIYTQENITPFYLKNGFEICENIFIGKVK